MIERYTPVRGFVCYFREIRKFHKPKRKKDSWGRIWIAKYVEAYWNQ